MVFFYCFFFQRSFKVEHVMHNLAFWVTFNIHMQKA